MKPKAVRGEQLKGPRALLWGLALLVMGLSTAGADELEWLNPEALPGVFHHPLQMVATTDKTAQGHDYYPLPGGEEAVIARITGPAIIFRIWSTSSNNGEVTLEMTCDGKTELIHGHGKLPPGAATDDPLRGLDGQSYWSYIPQVVHKEAVFKAKNLSSDPEPMKFYLQAGYRTVEPGELTAINPRSIEQMRQTMRQWLADPLAGTAQMTSLTTEALTPQQPWAVSFEQPALVRCLVLDATEATRGEAMTTRLTITCDDQRTIDVPLGALFGEYGQPYDYTAVAMAVSGKKYVLRLPQPVAGAMKIEVSGFNRGQPLSSLHAALYYTPLPASPRYRLCAQYFSTFSVDKEPMTMLQVAGSGYYLGSNLYAEGNQRRTFIYLEGNEQIYVDGATTPTIEGTGTEDYFNGAWYFEAGVLARALHGVTYLNPTPEPKVATYRHMLPDLLPFQTSLRFDLQHGSRNSAAGVSYRAVMLWYQIPPVEVSEPVEAPPPASDSGPGAVADDDDNDANPWSGLIAASLGALLVVVVAVVIMVRRRQ